MTALAEQRAVTSCTHCGMVQFMTASTLCRRCHKSIAPEPAESEPIPAPMPIARVTADDFSHIGATVRNLRVERNLTQQQLAFRMCVPRSYVSKTENGRLTPTLASLDRLAKALGVNIPTLLRDTLMDDPFLAEIAPYVAQLDETQRSIFLNTVRELAAKETR